MPIPSCCTTCIALRHSSRTGCGSSVATKSPRVSGRTGVVGVIKGRKPASTSDIRVSGLRADMDALPIEEANPSGLRVPDAGQDACLRP